MTTRWPWSACSCRKTLRARPTSSASFCAAKRHRGQAMSEEAVAALPRHLSGTQKSALLMMLLGEDEAADLLKHLNPREVQTLAQAMYSIAEVDQGTITTVLDDFILASSEHTSLALCNGPHLTN